MASSHSYSFGGTGPIPSEYLKYMQKCDQNQEDKYEQNKENLYQSLNISSDTISCSHNIDFCKPVPNDHFNCTTSTPGITDCGIYTKDLKDFPLDDLPSGGPCLSDMRISPSEMTYVHATFNNYPAGGPVTQTWKNRDTGKILYTATFTLNPPDPGWSWWLGSVWSYIGHFSWEIASSGNYQCIISTNWGSATIDFVVSNTIGKLAIASTPLGARIFVDEVDKGVNTPATISNLAVGSHSYRLVLSGYADIIGNFTIVPDSLTPVPKFDTFLPSAYFTSAPTNARIWIDNVDQLITTPATVTGLTVGTHTYKLVLAGYVDVSSTFPTTAGSTVPIPVTFLQGTIIPITASNTIQYRSDDVSFGHNPGTYVLTKELTLTADYVGSIRIYYEDAVYASGNNYTQVYKNGFPWGTSHIPQSYDQYNFLAISQDFTGISLANGTKIQIYTLNENALTQLYVQNFRIMFDLPPGNALFMSSPLGARIWVDEIDKIVNTPNTVTGIQPGQHNYTLKLTGYADKSGTFQITSGLTTTISDILTTWKTTTSSNVIKYSDDTTRYIMGLWPTLTKMSEITITDNYTGSWRIDFTLTGYDDYDAGNIGGEGVIYKNGIQYGTYRSVGGYSPTTFSEIFSNINIVSGDKIQLYGRGEDYGTQDSPPSSVSNFRIMFDLSVSTITISPSTAIINVGNTILLTTECRDENNSLITCPTLTWTSNNPTDATVDSTGLVTAVSVGGTSITCSAGGKTSNSSIITVNNPANIIRQNVTVGGISCAGGCNITCTNNCPKIVDIIITWANYGGSNGTFTPKITVTGGIPITGTPLTITIIPGEIGKTTTFTGVSLPQGSPQICIDIGTIT